MQPAPLVHMPEESSCIALAYVEILLILVRREFPKNCESELFSPPPRVWLRETSSWRYAPRSPFYWKLYNTFLVVR